MRRRVGIGLGIAAVMIAALVALRVALPGLMLERYRGQVENLGDYTGHAESIEVSVLALRYRLHGVSVARRDGVIDTPLVRADVSLQLHPLRGDSEVRVDSLRLHLVDGGGAKASQLGDGVPWRRLLDALAPASLPVSQLEVHDGALAIVTSRAPQVPIVLDGLQLRLDGLTAVPDVRTPMPAHIEGTGRLLEHAPTVLRLHFDPAQRMQRMQFELEVSDLELARLDAFAHAWGGIDFEGGRANARLQVGSIDTQVDGTLHVTLSDVDVFDAREDLGRDGDGLLRAAREMLFGGGAALARTRAGKIEVKRPVAASIDVPEDNFDGLRAALVAGLRALDAP